MLVIISSNIELSLRIYYIPDIGCGEYKLVQQTSLKVYGQVLDRFNQRVFLGKSKL